MSSGAPMAELSRQDALTIARIVRVNHAGEFGAIRIYSAQIMVAKRFWPDCVPSLSEMLGHERTHCAAFRAAMPARRSRPCRVMQFWSWGGWLLGFVTALLGPQGIWACTAAVEAAVHRHLDDQLFFLAAPRPRPARHHPGNPRGRARPSPSRRRAAEIARPRAELFTVADFDRHRRADLAVHLRRFSSTMTRALKAAKHP